MLPKMPRMMWLYLCMICAAGVNGTGSAQEEPTVAPGDISLTELLVIEPVGSGGRAAVHTDALEAELVAGRRVAPQAGGEVIRSDGSKHVWEAATAEEDGWFKHAALRGGYAYAAVESAEERVMLLEAAGHSMVYVNGEPRVGDPYSLGYVCLPVQLVAGKNDFLFRCGRGQLRARLIEPESEVALDTRDDTLPDLVIGEPVDVLATVVILNTRPETLRGARLVAGSGVARVETPVPPVPAVGVRKVGFKIGGSEPVEPGEREIKVVLKEGDAQLAETIIQLRVRGPDESRMRTFVSEIDGSVQYYAVQPARPNDESEAPPALFLSLHGASVKARGLADCYQSKTWGHVVVPTNRRPFGFDWEDWGRLDAMEVLALAEERLGTDPRRTYLTGHSMGGHGVWHVGVTFPDRFAAIAPSAAWISFWTYGGAQRFENPTPIENILIRATNPSDTLALSRNYLCHGIYILHGGKDEEVPLEQARTMFKHLATYHTDFAYYEKPGAKHWWGHPCVDWPPLFGFLKDHTRPATYDVRHVEFATANPAISATCYWATIEAQKQSLALSKINLHVDGEKRLIHGTTENVARLSLALRTEADEPVGVFEPAAPLTIELDEQRLEDVPWPADDRLRLEWQDEKWILAFTEAPLSVKGPHRAGPFKHVFRNRVQLVYGTRGTPEENAWALAKVRYDAEMFWYRGNGSFDVIPDIDFEPDAEPDRNVVLYGNADTNAAWGKLMRNSPVQVSNGRVLVGEREVSADDLAVLAIYPRSGSEHGLVGVVGGTGLVGMRLTDRLPYFVSGVAYPDWIVIGADVLSEGSQGVRGAGFFDNNWQIDPEQSAWQEP
ncbi:MAG: prolyl oligopeptidase family serine peptidase [Planctomycetota bacterium]